MPVSYFKVASSKPTEGIVTRRLSDLAPGDVKICSLPLGQSPQYQSYRVLDPHITGAQASGDIAMPTLAAVLPKLHGSGIHTFIRPGDRQLRFSDRDVPTPQEVELLIPKPGATQTQCFNLIANALSQKPTPAAAPSTGGVGQVFRTAGSSASGRTGSVPIADDDGVTGFRAVKILNPFEP